MSWSLPVNIVYVLFFILSSNFCLIYLLTLVVMEVNHEVMKTKIYPERSRAFYAEKLLWILEKL